MVALLSLRLDQSPVEGRTYPVEVREHTGFVVVDPCALERVALAHAAKRIPERNWILIPAVATKSYD
jgi:hypothetical protein